MNVNTTYMGIELNNPIIVGSSSLGNSVRNVKKCEESGAGGIVLKSLYEEQILMNGQNTVMKDDMYQWYPEAFEYVKSLSEENKLEKYLELVYSAKRAVEMPVFASINCLSDNNWVSFTKKLQDAGADGIELNIGTFPSDENQSSEDIEQQYINIVNSVRGTTDLPISVKLSSYFTNIRRISHHLVDSGASSLVLFNRFYRPDIDIDNLHMTTRDTLSGPDEITLSLRWVGLLANQLACDIAASTGIHSSEGVIKQILAGAKVVQICSVLYENGINYIHQIKDEMKAWMKRKGFDSLDQFRGLINEDQHNTLAWERIHFMKKTSGSIIKPIITP
jgi:dihydroorotate dehydrogenase (fumarate)